MLARILFALLIPVCAGAATPLEAFGRLPSIEFAALSPSGKNLALVQTVDDTHFLAIVSLADEHLTSGIKLGDAKMRAVSWADDDRILLTTASTQMPMGLVGEKVEWRVMQLYDVKRKKLSGLLTNIQGGGITMNVTFGRPQIVRTPSDTTLYLHGLYVDSETKPGLVRVRLDGGTERMIRQGNRDTDYWLLNDNGEIAAEVGYVRSDQRWTIQLFENGHPRQKLSGKAPLDPPEMLGLSPDGRSAVVALTEDEEVHWRYLSLSDGTWGEEIEPKERLTDLLLEQGTQRMIGTANVDDTPKYHFVDPAIQEAWNWVVRSFRGSRVEFESMSSNHSRMLVTVFGPSEGYAYYLADIAEHFTRRVGSVYAAVNEAAEVRKIEYPAKDGLKIPAYLTLPPGRPAKNLPLVAFPHGGPEARDRLEFDWWAQAMAAQGYAVLQPNFRGSSLGSEWVKAGYGEWGKKMQTDISDGVHALAEQGVIDPARVCIVGASYGGYAALAGVTLQSGIYRCAVAVAPVSDPSSMLSWVSRKEGGPGIGLRYWDRFMGAEGAKDKSLEAISPLVHAAQVTVPVLLIHGKDDATVPYDQSTQMVSALKKAGKSVELVPLTHEDHYLSQSGTRLQMLKSSVEFLKKYNPPDG